MFRVVLWMLLFALAMPAAMAGPVHQYRLDNGLKVIVKEDHRAPVVVSQVWYKVGSSYEHSGITGISHVLEHMMFQGTKKYPAGDFSRIIAENGGTENAFTSRDYTAYFQMLAKSRLPVSFRLEADRMRNLLLKKKEFEKEVHVVMEERRMRTDDNPEALTAERFDAVAYANSGYHIPVIGWMNDLQHLTVADLKAWYHRFYAPNNAILVVVGDVDPAHVYALAKRYFGPLKPSKIQPPKPRQEVEQKGIRRIVINVPAETPYVLMGYHVPVLRTAKDPQDAYALEVLSAILDAGDSARLARNLVRGSQVAASADAGYNLYARQDSLLMLDGVPATGHTADQLEQALREQIAQLRDKPVSEAELERVKTQLVAEKTYHQDSQFYQGMQIGTVESVGLGLSVLDQYIPRIRSVTAEQVQAVARKYLVDNHLTVAVLKPLPMKDGHRPRPRPLGGEHVR